MGYTWDPSEKFFSLAITNPHILLIRCPPKCYIYICLYLSPSISTAPLRVPWNYSVEGFFFEPFLAVQRWAIVQLVQKAPQGKSSKKEPPRGGGEGGVPFWCFFALRQWQNKRKITTRYLLWGCFTMRCSFSPVVHILNQKKDTSFWDTPIYKSKFDR